MKNEPYPIREIKESLEKLKIEAHKLKKLARGFPGVEKNVDPIIAFIDILDFHTQDLSSNDCSWLEIS